MTWWVGSWVYSGMTHFTHDPLRVLATCESIHINILCGTPWQEWASQAEFAHVIDCVRLATMQTSHQSTPRFHPHLHHIHLHGHAMFATWNAALLWGQYPLQDLIVHIHVGWQVCFLPSPGCQIASWLILCRGWQYAGSTGYNWAQRSWEAFWWVPVSQCHCMTHFRRWYWGSVAQIWCKCQSFVFLIIFHLTLSSIPYSCRILAKLFAKLSPECESQCD